MCCAAPGASFSKISRQISEYVLHSCAAERRLITMMQNTLRTRMSRPAIGSAPRPAASSLIALRPLVLGLVLTGGLLGSQASVHAQSAPVTTPAASQPAVVAPATPSPAAASSQSATPAAAGADLNFDLLDDGAKPAGPTPEQLAASLRIEKLAKIRRPMLTTHQALGFSTLAVMTANLVIGHLNYYDQYQSGNFTGRFEKAHLGLSISTSVLFGTTGLLGVFAPNPYPKPIRFDTALVHKLSMIMATAGMVTQVIMGPVAVARQGRLNQANIALGHVITGYATWAFMAAGTLAYVF